MGGTSLPLIPHLGGGATQHSTLEIVNIQSVHPTEQYSAFLLIVPAHTYLCHSNSARKTGF